MEKRGPGRPRKVYPMSTENADIASAAIDAVEEVALEAIAAQPDIMVLLQMLLKENREGTLDAIREMKRLPEDQQKKLDDNMAREKALLMRRIESAKRQDAKYADAWRNCSHKQPNGKTRFRGQGLSNGFAQAFCPECHYLSPPFQLAQHEMTGGLNISDWNGDVFGIIQARVRQSPLPQAIPDLPAGARIIF